MCGGSLLFMLRPFACELQLGLCRKIIAPLFMTAFPFVFIILIAHRSLAMACRRLVRSRPTGTVLVRPNSRPASRDAPSKAPFHAIPATLLDPVPSKC